jgi:uncharacterized membrane protein
MAEITKEKKLQYAKPKRLTQLGKEINSAQGKFAQAISDWAGSMSFVYMHVVWFTFWILANAGLLQPIVPIFDPFPYGLLTMVVSLEAIFLSTFIMISQNRQALIAEFRDLEEEYEHKLEDLEQDELEQDVEEISQDVEEIGRDVDVIQAGLQDLMKSVSQIQQKLILEKQKTSDLEKKQANTS